MQLTLENKTIDQEAIELLQKFEPLEGYYLGFSGGKDSQVCYDLCVRAKVKFQAYYNVSPIDPPEVRDFIKQYYPDVIWEYHAKYFWNKHFLSHGPPFRQTRWCCEIIKEAGGKNRVKVLGMRSAESKKRSAYQEYSLNNIRSRCAKDDIGATLLPVLYWKTNDVWAYIHENNLATCSLYRQGWKRIGCLLCPNASKREIRITLQKYPNIVNAYKRAFDRYYQVRIERGNPIIYHKSGEDYFNWWIAR